MISDPICRFDCDIPVDGVATFVFTSAERAATFPTGRCTSPGTPPERRCGTDSLCTGPWTTSWKSDPRRPGGCGSGRGSDPTEVDLPQVYDGFSPFVYLWMEALSLCPVGEAHQLALDGGIDSDRAGALPVLSGGGALGNGRMHGVPQMLECYLQLSRRAGERQRAGASIGLACHSSPHYGGAVAYSSEFF